MLIKIHSIKKFLKELAPKGNNADKIDETKLILQRYPEKMLRKQNM